MDSLGFNHFECFVLLEILNKSKSFRGVFNLGKELIQPHIGKESNWFLHKSAMFCARGLLI